MPDPWATYRCPSAEEGQPANNAPPETNSCVPANKGTFALARGFREARSRSATRNVETRSMVDEALDFYEKANGRDRTPKAPRAREHEARRTATKSGALASTCKRSATPPREEGTRVGPLQQSAELRTQEGGLRERLRTQSGVQDCRNWTDEMQSKVQRAERELEARERKWMEIGGLQFSTAPCMGEALTTRNLLLIVILFFASAMTARRLAVAAQSASDMNRLLAQINYAFMTSLHSKHGETCSVYLECIQAFPSQRGRLQMTS